jgi:hypothetical protein
VSTSKNVAIPITTTADARPRCCWGSDITDEQVRTADIRNGDVRTGDVLDSTLRGRDISNRSLTGADVDEATLAKVPNADKVDGLDSTAFLRAVSFEHTTTPENTADDCTRLDHPAINDNPNAHVVITRRLGQALLRPVAVTHSTSLGGWVICTEDTNDLPAGTYRWYVIAGLGGG